MDEKRLRRIIRQELKKSCCCDIQLKWPKMPSKSSRLWIPGYPFMWFFYWMSVLIDFLVMSVVVVFCCVFSVLGLWNDDAQSRGARAQMYDVKSMYDELGTFSMWRKK